MSSAAIFRERLRAAGLLDHDPQQRAIGDLQREYRADYVHQGHPRRDGSRRVRLCRHDYDRPVGSATVSRSGQVKVDVTEMIA
jgi:hypothetical protein